MNAKLLEKLVAYREARGLDAAKVLLSQKIRFQFATLKNAEDSLSFVKQAKTAITIRELLLAEARAARAYWRGYGAHISKTACWLSRKPQNGDPCNQLLDVGYHYISNRIAKLCEDLAIPTELGLVHRAQSAHAHPLVYDMIEWLRPVVVDTAVRIFFARKKKWILRITQRDIGRVLGAIKKRFERRYYHKRLGYCVTLAYWNRLVLLEFEKSVRGNRPFRPLFPSLRHETRCKNVKEIALRLLHRARK